MDIHDILLSLAQRFNKNAAAAIHEGKTERATAFMLASDAALEALGEWIEAESVEIDIPATVTGIALDWQSAVKSAVDKIQAARSSTAGDAWITCSSCQRGQPCGWDKPRQDCESCR